MNGDQVQPMLNAANLPIVIVFFFVTVLVLLFAQLIRKLRNSPADRLSQVDPVVTEEKLRGSFLAGLAQQLPMSQTSAEALNRELRRAGHYQPSARHQFLAQRNVLVLLALIATGMLAVLLGPEHPRHVSAVVTAGLIIAGLAWALPRIYLRQIGDRRIARIQDGLPSALDMLTMCTTGGLSMQDALSHVSRELHTANADLAFELGVVRHQADMTSLPLALKQFALRTDADEVAAMSALISEGQRLGAGMAASIQQYADSIRLRARQMADEKAGKAAVRLLFPIVLFLLPAILILMWGPAVLDLVEFLQQFEGTDGVDISAVPTI